MVTSDGRSVMRKRMLLYSISEGAGLMSFCFMMTTIASCPHERYVSQRDGSRNSLASVTQRLISVRVQQANCHSISTQHTAVSLFLFRKGPII